MHPREGEEAFYEPWVRRFLTEGVTGHELMGEECVHCSTARSNRRRVMRAADVERPELHEPPFDTAPALYAYNVPRYYTILLRAREYARINSLQLQWCVARDIPLHQDDRDLPIEQLDEKRWRWLHMHDQHTSHIASQLPLVQGLPIRITDAVDRKRGLFRGRRGNIFGWASHPEEERATVDGGVLLTRMPLAIYCHFPSATWVVHEEFGDG